MASIQIQKIATYHLDSKKINRSKIRSDQKRFFIAGSGLKDICLALDFLTFLENMKMLSSLLKILETGIKVTIR